MHRLALDEGYCCLYYYLSANDNKSSEQLAKRLGVNRRTVERWRAKLDAGDLLCRGDHRCRERESS